MIGGPRALATPAVPSAAPRRQSATASPNFTVLVTLRADRWGWSRTCGRVASRSPEVRLAGARPDFTGVVMTGLLPGRALGGLPLGVALTRSGRRPDARRGRGGAAGARRADRHHGHRSPARSRTAPPPAR